MRKVLLLILALSILPLAMSAGDNFLIHASDGTTSINGTDICVDIFGTPSCLSDAVIGAGDITAVNTNGPYLTGGAASGAVSLLIDETYLNGTITTIATAVGGGSGISWENATNGTLYLSTNPFGFFNSTDFSISDYYLESNPFGFFNSTDFSIGDYYLESNPFSYYNATNQPPGANSSWNESYANTKYVNLSGDTMTGSLVVDSGALYDIAGGTDTNDMLIIRANTEDGKPSISLFGNGDGIMINPNAGEDIDFVDDDTGFATWNAAGSSLSTNLTLSGGNFYIGDGSFLTGLSTGDNSSWNKTFADTLYYAINNPFGFFNSTDFNIADYYLKNNPFAYYNATNQPPGANSSWNESYANTKYYGITNPFAFYNSTDFDIADYYLESNPFGFYNTTDFDIADYYLESNPFSFYNETNPQTETDPFWTGNSSTVARIGDCAAGLFVVNTTISGVECDAPAGSGDITSVQGDNFWIFNGSDSGNVVLEFNATRMNATGNSRYVNIDGDTMTGNLTAPNFFGNISADFVKIALGSGSPTVDQLQEYLDNTGSSGFFLGGALSDGGAGTVDVAEGSGFIRTTNDDNAELQSFKWSASAGIAIADDTTQYVYVNNTGVISLSPNEFLEVPNKIKIGVVTDEGGTTSHTFALGVRLQESVAEAGRFIRRVHGISRDTRRGGLIMGQSGDANRDVTMTEGSLWWGRTEYIISSFDTSGADTFSTYSAGGQENATASQFPNTEYDNAGTLTTIGNNKWANLFFFLEPDGHVVMIYGRSQFASEALAGNEGVPSTSLPSRVSETSILVSRFTFQESSNSATISSAFDTLFANAAITDHGNLAGLTDDDHTQYLLADGSRNLSANWNQGAVNFTNTTSWFLGLINWSSIVSKFLGSTTDDLTEGSTNLYDNSSWNKSAADLLYYEITNPFSFFNTTNPQTETDPFWTGNQSSYSTTSDIISWGYFNLTDFDINDYYLESNPFAYYNITDFDITNYFTWANATNGTLAQTDTDESFTSLVTGNISGTGDPDTYINWSSADQLEFFAGGISFIHMIEGAGDGIAFNQDSNDIDWRVESTSHTHALAVDAGTNKVRMENYTSCNSLETDATGILSCGTGSGIGWDDATNGTLYLSTNPFGFFNSTDFSIADYYLESNPFGFFNSTDFTIGDYYLDSNPYSFYNATNPQAETDPFWTGNQSSYSTTSDIISWAYYNATVGAGNITAGTFGTGDYVMDGNLTVEKIVFENSASHFMEDNSTCVKIYGSTSILEIC